MKNFLTVDLEYWFDVLEVSAGFRNKLAARYGDRLAPSLEPLLSLLDERDTRATFFVVGELARKHPSWIREIHRKGHAVALHGNQHRSLTGRPPEDVKRELKTGLDTLSEILEEEPLGFRAPGWSIDTNARDHLPAVAKCGFVYDSSIHPAGYRHIFRSSPVSNPIKISIRGEELYEFSPTSVFQGCSGPALAAGWSFRYTPEWWIHRRIRSLNNRGQPAIVSIHNWDFDQNQPRINWPFPVQHGRKTRITQVPGRLEKLLTEFHFTPVEDSINAKKAKNTP